MATFVLVAGAMHGGWAFGPVADLLRSHGHKVVTPSLTGTGDRGHLLDPSVNPSTHVEDLRRVLFYEDLTDAHVVLHSYAGALAGPLCEVAGDRIAKVIFLGAFLVEDGESFYDTEPPETAARYLRLAEEDGDGWRVPASAAFLEQWGVPEHLRPWVAERLMDFPLRCGTDPVRFDPTSLEATSCAYVRHTAPAMASLEAPHDRAVARGYDMHDIALSHDMMLEDPGAVAALLDSLAR